MRDQIKTLNGSFIDDCWFRYVGFQLAVVNDCWFRFVGFQLAVVKDCWFRFVEFQLAVIDVNWYRVFGFHFAIVHSDSLDTSCKMNIYYCLNDLLWIFRMILKTIFAISFIHSRIVVACADISRSIAIEYNGCIPLHK